MGKLLRKRGQQHTRRKMIQGANCHSIQHVSYLKGLLALAHHNTLLFILPFAKWKPNEKEWHSTEEKNRSAANKINWQNGSKGQNIWLTRSQLHMINICIGIDFESNVEANYQVPFDQTIYRFDLHSFFFSLFGLQFTQQKRNHIYCI